MDNFGKGAIVVAVLLEAVILWDGLDNHGAKETSLSLLVSSLIPLAIVGSAFLPLDHFGKGAIVLALLIESFIFWGSNNPNETLNNTLYASLLPAVLIGTVLLFWWLQKGET
jgi:hypothetical protein